MRHGAEPWTERAVGSSDRIHYATSAFAPKDYPRAILDDASTREANEGMDDGCWPMGLSLERLFAELPQVRLRDERWLASLPGNAVRGFGP